MVLGVQLHAHPQGVLLAHFAESGAGTSPYAAYAEADRGAGRHTQFFPDGVDLFLFYSHQGNTGGAGDFHGLDFVFFRDIGQPPQHFGGDNAAGDVRRDGVSFLVPLNNGPFFSQFEHCTSSSGRNDRSFPFKVFFPPTRRLTLRPYIDPYSQSRR